MQFPPDKNLSHLKFKLEPQGQPSPSKKKDRTLKNWDVDHLEALTRELDDILGEMSGMETSFSEDLKAVNYSYQDSSKNFLHYMALRQRDIRELQTNLASLGLSSLGRSESHVMTNVIAVRGVLEKLSGLENTDKQDPISPVDYEQGNSLLGIHTKELFGDSPGNRNTFIMVTMPHQAANDYKLVKELLASGMDCVRINCAHDDEEAWSGMITNLRRAERELNRKCRIFMDLAGHKLRTGPIDNVPAVARWSPKRDAMGKNIAPARIWLTPVENKVMAATPVDVCIPLPLKWLTGLGIGDSIEFKDTRGRQRMIEVVAVMGNSRMGECSKSAYVTNGTVFIHHPRDPLRQSVGEANVSELPAKEQFIVLSRGDMLILTKGKEPGRPPVFDEKGQLLKPATVGVTMPEIFASVKSGDRVWFDDGKIGGVVRFVNKDQVHVEITQARYSGDKLKPDKGINLPDSDLVLPPITKKDLRDLKFITANADAVCFSFVNDASDVIELQARLKEYGGEHLGIILKIETLHAFENLPGIILAAMRSPCVGVMIARGDLAIECGYERMAEIQEEILWLCEAAHVPVIWATQVLEKLAKKGTPSRAEITDAAMAVRAECVMLNKGPYILDAVHALDDVLGRMRDHQSKKVSRLRELKLASRFGS
jgi:pyruvate kinase